MRPAIAISLIAALALGLPTPGPFEVSLGVPAAVVDGHPIKVPEERRNLASDIGVKSKLSIGDHTVEVGGGAVSVGGHSTGGSVGNVIQPYFPHALTVLTNLPRTLDRQLVFTVDTLNPILP